MPASEPPSRRASGERAATWLTLGLVVAFAVGLSVFEINNDDGGPDLWSPYLFDAPGAPLPGRTSARH